MYASGETSRETTYVLIGSVWWMTTLGETCAVTKNGVQVNNNNYNIYRAPKVRKLDRSLYFIVTRGNVCVNENQIRDQTKEGRRAF